MEAGRKKNGEAAPLNGLQTGLTVTGPEDISYAAAVEKVKKTDEYITLKGVVEDPYLVGDSYNWLVEFLESRATKFWRYLKIRQAGKVDKDRIRAASILEYSRLIAKLVENFQEFNLKLIPLVLKQFPQDFPEGQVPSAAELVVLLENLNGQDYVDGPKETPSAQPVRRPPTAPGLERPTETAGPRINSGEKAEEIGKTIIRGIEEQIGRDSPQFAGFSFESKCGLLGLSDWSRIINGVAEKYPELQGLAILEVIEAIKDAGRDPRIQKIYEFIKQLVF